MSLTAVLGRRKKAIKDLLMRQSHTLEDWQVVGLRSLRIPMEWIEEAQVMSPSLNVAQTTQDHSPGMPVAIPREYI